MSEFVALALFVYNRPEHTRRTIEALLENPVDSIKLYVFSDGPREGNVEAVNEFIIHFECPGFKQGRRTKGRKM